MKTKLSIDGTKFLINGSLTYSEYPDCPEKYKRTSDECEIYSGCI